MRTYKHLFDTTMQPETVLFSALDAAEHKLGRHEVMYALTHMDETYETVCKCANDPEYKPCEDNVHQIIDGANNKKREIEKPKYCPEQILHHMIIEPFKPVLLNGLYEQVYGCLPPSVRIDKNGKKYVRKYGPHAAIKTLTKWVQTGTKMYVAEVDVKHAYGSVSIPILAAQLEEAVRDKEWLRLVFQFLHYDKNDQASEELVGLVLGHYTSPWFFNFYLKKFDHFAAALPGVKYLRFADNLYFVGKNKRNVHRAVKEASAYLARELRLELNGSRQVFRFEYPRKDGARDKKGRIRTRGRAVNALGAVIHHNRVTLRKGICKRTRAKAHRVHRKEKVTWHDGASIFSRLSWFRFTDTQQYYRKHIKPYLDTRKLKRRVRVHQKKLQKISDYRRKLIHDKLEESTRFAAYAAGRC